MLIKNKDGTQQVALTAIGGSGASISFSSAVTIGTGLTDPVALSWYDADHLMVLSQSQLYEVPVNGGAPIAAGPAPGAPAGGRGRPRPGGDGRRRGDPHVLGPESEPAARREGDQPDVSGLTPGSFVTDTK